MLSTQKADDHAQRHPTGLENQRGEGVGEWYRLTLIVNTLFGQRNIEIWLLSLKLSVSKGVHKIDNFLNQACCLMFVASWCCGYCRVGMVLFFLGRQSWSNLSYIVAFLVLVSLSRLSCRFSSEVEEGVTIP